MRNLVVTVAIGVAIVMASSNARAQLNTDFGLKTNPTILNCLRITPTATPFATVSLRQGDINDDLTILVANVKPHLAFDLFTVQNSSLTSAGTPDPKFKNFGLAWYQTDLEADSRGIIVAAIRSIFVNQIFGFDAGASPPLPPTNTFHVGFWFNNPTDAAACGFTGFTPFNGEHHAGPLAMISLPNATTGLGPLCLSPNTATHPATCNP